MKKIFLFSSLIMSIFFTVQAGYVTKSLAAVVASSPLENYTLTFDGNGEPVAAASMLDPRTRAYKIVVVQANHTTAYIFHVNFEDDTLPIKVKDFHYEAYSDNYILCGSRGSHAFVAVIYSGFSYMRFMEYPEASIFYSILESSSLTDYYVCGSKDGDGIIGSVNKIFLHLTSLYTTVNWEYHKIILKEAPLRIVVSGRDPACTYIGYTMFTPTLLPVHYRWEQNTEPASLCVVSDNMLENNQVILTSSYQNLVTLTPVVISSPFSGISYHFTDFYADILCIQDISTIEEDNNIRIDVAGYTILGSQHRAWHGTVTGLSGVSIMRNNNYYNTDQYKHYKVKYSNDETYTGGFTQYNHSMNVLFGTPLKEAKECDNIYDSNNTESIYVSLQFRIYPVLFSEHSSVFPTQTTTITYSIECYPFKGPAPAPELTIPAENESEIITYYDRITVKDIPMNTNYQIYNIVGQLVQAGAANPDISTSSLNKGIYILRLENGKAFKFVR